MLCDSVQLEDVRDDHKHPALILDSAEHLEKSIWDNRPGKSIPTTHGALNVLNSQLFQVSKEQIIISTTDAEDATGKNSE